MVDFTALASFIPASLVIILSPGADTFLLLRFAVRAGRRAGFLAMLGILLGLSTISLLLISGIGLLVSQFPLALDVLSYLGIGVLLFLGLLSLRSAQALMRSPHDQTIGLTDSAEPLAGLQRPLALSFITNITNPKVLIFYLAFFPQFLGTAQSVVGQLVLLSAAFLVVTVVWLVPLVYAASAARAFFAKRPVAIAMEFSVAAVFLLLAVILLIAL